MNNSETSHFITLESMLRLSEILIVSRIECQKEINVGFTIEISLTIFYRFIVYNSNYGIFIVFVLLL